MTDTITSGSDEAAAKAEQDREDAETKALEDAQIAVKTALEPLSDNNKRLMLDYIPQLLRLQKGGFY
jgi:hypothetical protein